MRNRMTSLALLVGITLAAGAQAADKPQSNDYQPGAKVSIDPATGKLRQPTTEELAALRASKQAPAARTLGKAAPRNEAEARRTQRKLSGGRGVVIEVPEDRMSTVVAVRQADGSIKIVHEGEKTEADSE